MEPAKRKDSAEIREAGCGLFLPLQTAATSQSMCTPEAMLPTARTGLVARAAQLQPALPRAALDRGGRGQLLKADTDSREVKPTGIVTGLETLGRGVSGLSCSLS